MNNVYRASLSSLPILDVDDIIIIIIVVNARNQTPTHLSLSPHRPLPVPVPCPVLFPVLPHRQNMPSLPPPASPRNATDRRGQQQQQQGQQGTLSPSPTCTCIPVHAAQQQQQPSYSLRQHTPWLMHTTTVRAAAAAAPATVQLAIVQHLVGCPPLDETHGP